MKILSVLAMLMLFVISVQAQETTRNNFTGSWRSNGSWVDNSFPSNTTGINGGNFNIFGYITLGTSGARQNLTVSNATDAFDFIVRDTLVIFGDVDFPNNGMDLVISSGALLIVFGNLTLGNQMDVSTGGNIIVTGTFTKSGSAGQGSYTGGGNTYAGTFNLPGAGTWVPAADQRNTGANLSTDLPAVFNFVNNGGSGSLPVELTSFIGNVQDDQVIINWSTASQLNFSHFEVEHSINAQDWQVLTSIQGEGTTNELKNYIYTHTMPQDGRNYYRLRMVDLDDTFEYSEILVVQVKAKQAFTISPNPAKGGLVRYALNFSPTPGDQLVVYDLMGGQVTSTMVSSFIGEFLLPASLSKGTYLVRYQGQGANHVLRLYVD